MPADRALTVVKLGGSFAFSPHLSEWLDAIAAGAGHVVLVPGGGPFADTVREAQPRMGFDDWAAHHMALLAMEQYAFALLSLDARPEPRFRLGSSLSEIRGILINRNVPVWAPS